MYILYFYTLLCTVESGYCLIGAPYLLEPRELGGHTWRASSLFKHGIGGGEGWEEGRREGGSALKPRERFIKGNGKTSNSKLKQPTAHHQTHL